MRLHKRDPIGQRSANEVSLLSNMLFIMGPVAVDPAVFEENSLG